MTEADILAFVARHQARVNEHFAKHYKVLKSPTIRFTRGPKYVRVVTDDGNVYGGSVVCFLALATGDIYKAASWKQPAKHARGNVFAPDGGDSCMTSYGAAYLR